MDGYSADELMSAPSDTTKLVLTQQNVSVQNHRCIQWRPKQEDAFA